MRLPDAIRTPLNTDSRLRNRTAVAVAVTTALAMFAGPQAHADDTDVQALKQQVQQLQHKIDELAARQSAQATASAPAQATAAPAGGGGSPSFYAGPIKITPGGFVELMAIDRNREEFADWASNYNTSIPFPNSHNYDMSEFHLTERQSRLQALVEGPESASNKVWGYVEMDFGGATTNGNNNQSSSFAPRVRHFYADYQNSDTGLSLLFGQTWSLVTGFKSGLTPRQENIPQTIDGQYVPGFDWLRVPQIRISENFNDVVNVGVSLENPAVQVSANNNLPGTLPTGVTNLYGNSYYLAAGASNAYASTTNVTTDSLPDIVAKVAVDPGYGHYELFGVMRWFRSRYTLTGAQDNQTTHGTGIGASVLLPLVPKLLDFQASVLAGTGVGRYGSTGEPDATVNPTTGALAAIRGFQTMGGLTLHLDPVTLFGYVGLEKVDSRSFNVAQGTAGTIYGYGYGNALFSNAGCEGPEGTSLTCSGNTNYIASGTAGGWWKFYQGPLGNMQVGLTDTYLKRQAFEGVGGAPSTNMNIVAVSFRYYPFQK